MGGFSFFPTPYPDEVLYSVLCRYHVRSGNPGSNTTVKELWDSRGVAKSLYLPGNLDRIIRKLPPDSGLTAKTLIWGNTMYAYVYPSLPGLNAQTIYEIMCGENTGFAGTYNKAGLVGRKLPTPAYLRYCPSCMKQDVATYGEAYWHRLHQLPGVLVCTEHGEPILDSPIYTHLIFREFYPASPELCHLQKQKYGYPSHVFDRLATLAEDSAWLLKNGGRLGVREQMVEKYQTLLYLKNLRMRNTEYVKLYRAVVEYYGEEFLNCINSLEADAATNWTTRIYRNDQHIIQPAHHLLMMRFLCGSPNRFLESDEEIKPFGDAPWPCHNQICDFYLKDCIQHIDIKFKSSKYKAIFTCPHCGFSYRRADAMPKEQQYQGHVRMDSFGWLWEQKLLESLQRNHYCIDRTRKEMKCSDTAVRKYALKLGFMEKVRMPKKRIYQPKGTRVGTKTESGEFYRQRWLKLISDNPDMTRTQLSFSDFRSYKWLRANDVAWYEANTPAPLRRGKDWPALDEEYLGRVQKAVQQIATLQGRPKWICKSSVANVAGIGNPIYARLQKLPRTLAFLEAHIEEKDEWRKRKIRWAIQHLKKDGEKLSAHNIREKCGISVRVFPRLRYYVDEQIADNSTDE